MAELTFEVGQAVWMRRPFVGWVKGEIQLQIGDYDTWKVSTGHGENYLRHGRDLHEIVIGDGE